MAKIPYSKDELFGQGEQRVFTGEQLREIAFPLGGIGTGTISLGGRGNLRDWEILNRPAKGNNPPYTFVAIYAKKAGGEPVARLLESRLQPSFVAGPGMPPDKVCGLPRLRNATFRGEYPLAWVDFEDKNLPVDVSLEAFNPFIPLNEKDSGLPVAILRYTVKNTTNAGVDCSIVFNMNNFTGQDLGGGVNEYVDDKRFRGFKMTSPKPKEDDARFGSMALVTTCPDVDALPAWRKAGWWDALRLFWYDFITDGRLETDGKTHSSEGDSTVCALCARLSLKPGESKDVVFMLTWYFPNRGSDGHTEGILHNWYYTQFANAWDVARYVETHFSRLERETRTFHDALFSSKLPATVLDAASANMSIIRTTTCFRTDDGRFFGYEGCGDHDGCCPMNCTHVWNYEQALAFLFPAMERTMRLTDFQTNVDTDGRMAFRSMLPLGRPLWGHRAAADGQMGCIIKYYREWQMSGDQKFVEELYPQAKKALEYAWKEWDKDRDGMMEAIQHNTYDIEFLGPNTMMGTLYLGALKAMTIIAGELGHAEDAAAYKEVYDKGRVAYDKLLWNGEFYVQKYDPKEAPQYQFGEGCLSDQMLGQWFAHVADLGYVLLEPHVKKTMESVFEHNWHPDLSGHHNCQRTYALGDEAGLILCSWPNGGQPALPFVYSDEVWTGIEYQVAAHLIYEDLISEGLAIVKGARDRHDGYRRNPWNEFECGHHYARAMSSWSLIPALSGYTYSAPKARIGFAPRIFVEDFRAFYSTGSAWGTYGQTFKARTLEASLEVLHGELPVKTLALAWPKGDAPKRVKLETTFDGRPVKATTKTDGADLVISFDSVTVKPGTVLKVRASA
ncbi:MAG: GH116 family glycosyl-hydrolase [Armatimonadota bacterium]|nr:GH116 family glycosyl-hydrolase [Armatimonadota bacterium]